MTYETIIARMIARITDKYPQVDTREGSMVFNAVAAAAMELAIMYEELDNVLRESFVETATREYILMACEEMGIDITVFNATAGIFKGEFNIPIELSSRWNMGLYNYIVVEELEQENNLYIYKLQCETVGTEPNGFIGDLTPIDEVNGDLTIARISECIVEGEDETSDDDIRQYYFDYVNSVAIDGNVSQYEQWCRDYNGIGGFKIFPLWNGANTVKVSILNVSNHAASEELIAEFQEYLDPGITGMGDGIAPIGAFVTVSTATEIPLNITANVSLKDGYTETTSIEPTLEKYLSELAYETSRISYMGVGAAIMNAEGVDFVTNLLINGSSNDITLGNEEIPILGSTNWTVIT